MPNRQQPSETRVSRLEERKAQRQIQRTRLGVVCGCIAIATAPLTIFLTRHSIAEIQKTYGVHTRAGGLGGDLSPLALTYILGAGLVIGGIGLLAPRSWGWWLTAAAAVLGPFDLFRIYRSLFAAINFDHPDVDKVLANLALFTGIPMVFYGIVIALLLVRSVRQTYRVGV